TFFFFFFFFLFVFFFFFGGLLIRMSLVRVQSEEPNLGKQTFTDVCFLHLYQLINPFFRFTLVY
ncbi:hypothetical protein K795_01242, partial [Salmonella enterica subsp. enterica serovar Newport str. SHSN005]